MKSIQTNQPMTRWTSCLIVVGLMGLLAVNLSRGIADDCLGLNGADWTNRLGMRFVLVPSGQFIMGSSSEEIDRDGDEAPHRVRISRQFYMARHEVTVAQFRNFVDATDYRTEAEQSHQGGYGLDASSGIFERRPGYTWRTPGHPQEDDSPVVNIGWNDAQAFCRWLSKAEGCTYRLPTEAQWEYACRAGSTTRYSSGNDAASLHGVANLADATYRERYNSAKWSALWDDGFVFASPVGSFQPNAFGLYDLHGNVWEWCRDWYAPYPAQVTPDEMTVDPTGPQTGTHRVMRGGSWNDYAAACRCATRGRGASPDRHPIPVGFRIMCRAPLGSAAKFPRTPSLDESDWVESDSPVVDNRQPAAAPDWITPVDGSQLEPILAGGFTVAVLPDTQNYCWLYPRLVGQQTEWIVRNARAHNIQFVVQLGDSTQHNNDREWLIVERAFYRLQGRIPYAIVPGNHDCGFGGTCTTRSSLLSKYFPVDSLRSFPTFGGVYDRELDKSDNSFHRFAVGDRKCLILGLEFAPRDDVVRWANEVVSRYPDHAIILITHAYMDQDGDRFNTAGEKKQVAPPSRYGIAQAEGGFNDGEQLWQKLVSRHPNFAMTLNGHVGGDGLEYVADQGKYGNRVHQIVVNYQNVQNGGDGWLRLLRFLPDGKKVQVRDYSPKLDKVNAHGLAHFEFELDTP